MKGIYKIYNATQDRAYIGQSKDIDNRFKTHKSLLNKGRHSNIEMQEDFDRGDEFSFSILEETTDLTERENYYIELEINSYNKVKNVISESSNNLEIGFNYPIRKEESLPNSLKGCLETLVKLKEDMKGKYLENETIMSFVDSIDRKFKGYRAYYNMFGVDDMGLSGQKMKRKMIANSNRGLEQKIQNLLNLSPGTWISKKDLKASIQKAYNELEIVKVAKSSDISLYYEVKESQRRIGGKRVEGVSIIISKTVV